MELPPSSVVELKLNYTIVLSTERTTGAGGAVGTVAAVIYETSLQSPDPIELTALYLNL